MNEDRTPPKAQGTPNSLSSPACLLSELEDPVSAGYLSDVDVAELLAQIAADLQACGEALKESAPRAAALNAMGTAVATLRTGFPTLPDPPPAPGEPPAILQQIRARLNDALLRLHDNAAITRQLRELRDQLNHLPSL